MENQKHKFMQHAIQLSIDSVENKGGPFGAVIVKDNKIIAATSNSVTQTNDPTAHAEINAIRKACSELKTFDLSDCEIYTSCEPCPMCLGAIYWARISKIYYGNTKNDAAKIGFNDSFIYEEIALSITERQVKTEQLLRKDALKAFQLWSKKEDKKDY